MEINQALKTLCEKYSVSTDAVINEDNTVKFNGKTVPLMPWRSERRLFELKNVVNNGTLVGVSVMRVARIVTKGSDIYAELYRELDICQYVLQRKIKSITVMENDNVLNAIATCEDGVVCTIEISATLKKGEPVKDKHEIISQRGIACDIVVDAQLKQDSIYIFGDENKKYTDVDFELYGLSIEETAVVRAAFSVAQHKNYDEMIAIDENLKKLIEMAKESAKTGEREVM